MKKIVLFSLMMLGLPFLSLAQNTNDDLYFIPKKKKEKVEEQTVIPAKVVVEKQQAPTTVYASPGTTVIVKDVEGNERDVDEYNRRYTSRDNTFSMENDTLYIEEKPYNERGEWVNGFEGSQSDYEYAMRIIRFRNPRYAIPVSSPLYWEVVYTLPSWEWNVFDDGHYAYVFPTYSNSLWWDWRFDYTWGWPSAWYYGGWYSPYYYPYYNPYYHHHYHPYPYYPYYPYPYYAGVGGYWGGHGRYGSNAYNPGNHAGRYASNHYKTTGKPNTRQGVAQNQNGRTNSRRTSSMRTSSGRVVTSDDASASVRPQRSVTRTRTEGDVNNKEASGVRSNSKYTRPVEGRGSSYNRQSSTRSTVTDQRNYQRKSGEAAERGAYRSNSSSKSSESRSSYSRSNNSSSSRSSYSSGSSSSSRSRGGHSGAGGGSSRSGGGRR